MIQISHSLVCRLWSAAARSCLFRVVTISTGLPSSSSLLCDPTSTILSCVHTIRFEEGIDSNNNYVRHTPLTKCLPIPDQTHTAFTAFLNAVLPMIRARDLAALRSLEVVDLTWAALSTESRHALFELCRPITSLALFCVRGKGISSSGLVELLGGVTAVSSLAKLHISNPHPHTQRYVPSDIPPPPTKVPLPLRSLTPDRHCMVIFLPKLLALFTFPHITHLAFRVIIGPDDVGDVVSLLRGCALDVECLRLGFDDILLGQIETEDDDPISERACLFLPPPLSLHSCIALSSALFLTYGGLSGLPALCSVHLTADPRWLPPIIQPLSACEHLKDLTIQASLDMLHRCNLDEVVRSLLSLAWARTSVHVVFFCDPETDYWEDGGPVGPTLNDMQDELITRLTDLRRQGRLQFL